MNGGARRTPAWGAQELVDLEAWLMLRAAGMPLETPGVRPAGDASSRSASLQLRPKFRAQRVQTITQLRVGRIHRVGRALHQDRCDVHTADGRRCKLNTLTPG